MLSDIPGSRVQVGASRLDHSPAEVVGKDSTIHALENIADIGKEPFVIDDDPFIVVNLDGVPITRT